MENRTGRSFKDMIIMTQLCFYSFHVLLAHVKNVTVVLLMRRLQKRGHTKIFILLF